MAKRGYKLQEFVAHASNVNCLNIGRKSSRLLVTGGEDQKVNLWAIGRPTSLLSLSGHTSPVESVIFDSAEVLVLSGASFGVIKLWDLEEAKIVRTLTGHRSSCNALQFHPFGEFFASGSSDTSLKIWDVRKKGCIHTYKGHTRGVSTIRFSPDGRWVVSGGADNIVKIWDLTAGKLLHEFKFHEGQIQCIDFHPLEFLLATGSADKTVKFWDLETFEMIGSAGPEATEVRSMTFHPDGKTLFCGLEDSLKVFSWEPIICHDSVDMGWSTLGDLNINEGKLLGCSYYHNCVGVWAADINLFGPYVAGVPPQSTGHLQQKFDTQANHALQKVGNVMKSSSRFTTTPEDDETPEIRNIYMDTSGSNKIIPERMGINSSTVVSPLDSPETNGPSTLKRIPQIQAHLKSSGQSNNTKFNVPVVVPRNNSENLANFGSEVTTRENTAPGMVVKPTHVRRESNGKYEIEKLVTNEAGRDSDKVGVPKLSLDRDSYVMLPFKVESTEIGGNPTYSRREPNDKYETEKLSVSNVPGRYVNKVGGSNISPSENFRSRIRSKVDSTVKVKEDNDKDVKNVAERFERVLSSDDLSTSRRYSSKVDSTLTVKEDSHKDIKNVSERFERVLSSDNLSTSRRHSSKVDSTVTLKEDSYKDIKNVTERFERVLSSNDLLSSKRDNGVESHCPGSEISSTQKVNKVQLGRTRSLVERFEKRVKSSSDLTSLDTTSTKLLPETPAPPHMSKEQPQTSGRESTYMDDEYVLEDLMRSSGAFISSFQSRLAKLQVVRYFWQRNDVKGGLNAVGKLPDHYVQADVVSVLIEKMDIVSLELFSLLLPMLLGLLNSQIDRHTHISLEMLLKLVAIFGPVIRSTVSASPSIGVDLHAEKRREWCSQCFTQLQKIKQIIPSVTRRGGILEKYAHELNLLLQES